MNKDFRGLIEDIKEKYDINQGEIAVRLGVTRQYISSIIGGTAPFNDTLKAKIASTFPDIEISKRGENYIPVVDDAIRLYMRSNALSENDLAKRLNITQAGVNSVLRRGFGVSVAKKWAETFGFNVEFLTTGVGQLTKGDSVQAYADDNTVPLLPVFAQAGSLIGWSDGVEEHECERVISPVRDIDMAVHIYGESMYPDIPNGSVCYVKRVNSVIEWGRAFILDTVDGPLLKYLTPGSDDEHIRCVSANHDPKYAPFEVAKNDILGIYRVVMCMAMK